MYLASWLEAQPLHVEPAALRPDRRRSGARGEAEVLQPVQRRERLAQQLVRGAKARPRAADGPLVRESRRGVVRVLEALVDDLRRTRSTPWTICCWK